MRYPKLAVAFVAVLVKDSHPVNGASYFRNQASEVSNNENADVVKEGDGLKAEDEAYWDRLLQQTVSSLSITMAPSAAPSSSPSESPSASPSTTPSASPSAAPSSSPSAAPSGTYVKIHCLRLSTFQTSTLTYILLFPCHCSQPFGES